VSTTLTYPSALNKKPSMLTALSKYDYTALSIPCPSQDIHPVFAKITTAESGKKISSERILEIHLRLLSDLYSEKYNRLSIAETSVWKTITHQLQWFEKESAFMNYFEDSNVRIIGSRLQKLYRSINASEKISVSCAHHNFTPWKLNADENRLYRFQWETTDCGIPMLTDLFHYFFLRQIVTGYEDYTYVKKSIDASLEFAEAKKIIRKYKINTLLHFRLYLLFSISHYVRTCINQNVPLVQMHRLMKVWNEALSDTE